MKTKENTISNPKDVGITTAAKEGTISPSNTGIRVEEHGNPVGSKIPNPKRNGIGDADNKERIVNWVQRMFGPLKEVLNVTLNHSYQEVPSQTFVEPPKSTRETRGDRSLLSDEIEGLADNSKANTSTRVDE